MARRRSRLRRRLALTAALLLVPAAGCVPANERSSGRVFPLPRHEPHDGLAVVNRPGGEGLHVYLDTDTRHPGSCAPRWHVETALLSNGDSPNPTSTGRVAAAEFFTALKRGRVRLALRLPCVHWLRQRRQHSRALAVRRIGIAAQSC